MFHYYLFEECLKLTMKVLKINELIFYYKNEVKIASSIWNRLHISLGSAI